MTASRKTDNHDPRAKLDLRRHFLSKYHAAGSARVLDCCMGRGWIWRELRKEYKIESYLGLDVKPRKGRLKIDSARYLEAGGWNHDVIDIDTYGSPWSHWLAVLKFSPSACTVFLTIGLVRMSGGSPLPTCLRELLRLPNHVPAAIQARLYEPGERAALGVALDNFAIIEAVEAESHGNARYIGVRLEIKKAKIIVDS